MVRLSTLVDGDVIDSNYIKLENIKIPVSCFRISRQNYIELHKLYHGDSVVRHQSFKKILKMVRHLKLNIKSSKIKLFLESQNVYSMHMSHRVPKKHNPMNVFEIDSIHQIDLAFMYAQKLNNHGNIGFLVIIDCFSRRGYGFPIKSKKSRHIGKIIRKFYSTFKKKPLIQSDSGGEFQGYTKTVFNDLGMEYKILTSENKASYVERLIRTLRDNIAKLLTENGDGVWDDHLQSIMTNYNNTYHSAICMAPNEVTRLNSHQVVLDSITMRKNDYENENVLPPKAFVRILLIHKTFSKGSWARFSGEVFRISCRRLNFRPRQYSLKDMNNVTIEGWFTSDNLKVLKYTFLEVHCMMEIESVVREFKMGGVVYLELKFRYYGHEFNSIVRKKVFDVFHVF